MLWGVSGVLVQSFWVGLLELGLGGEGMVGLLCCFGEGEEIGGEGASDGLAGDCDCMFTS